MAQMQTATKLTDAGPRPRLSLAYLSVHGDPLAKLGQEGAGGQNVYVHRLAGQMARLGHDVDVFTRAVVGLAEVVPVEPGYRVIRLPAGPAGYVDRAEMLPHLPAFAAAVAKFARATRRHYDLIHSHYWLSGHVGMTLAAEWGVPRCHTNHSLGAVKVAAMAAGPADGSQRLAIERDVLLSADRVIATSPHESQDIRSQYRVSPVLRQIPCGVDTDLFRPLDGPQARSVIGIPDGTRVLAYVGRFDPQKGIETLLRATALLRDADSVQVLLAGGSHGDGPDQAERERLHALAIELGLGEDVRFLGPCTQDQLPLIYAAADLVAIPSTYESFGITAIEAMACARPVVAHRVGGLAHSILEGLTGLLVAPHQPAAFAGACARLLRDPALRAEMGANGRRRVLDRYGWHRVAAEMEAAYAEVAVAAGQGPGRVAQ